MYDVFTFKWDDRKAHDNFLKHGVDFEEAMSAFFDELSWCSYDSDHSVFEQRYLLFGTSKLNRMLVVVHIVLEQNEKDVIRIISARVATKSERKEILKYWG